MSMWEDFDSEARTVEHFTKAQLPDTVQLLQDVVGLLAEAFSHVHISDTSDVSKAKSGLLSQNFNTLKCAVDLVLRGYYSQSMNLLRHVYENWIAFHYLSKRPEEAHLLLQMKKNKKIPNHAVMINELGDDNFLKRQKKDWYKVLCRFAHPHAVGTLHLMSDTFVPDEISIFYGTTYKDELFRASAYSISVWAGVMLEEVGQWISSTSEWHQKRSTLVESVLKFIDEEDERLRAVSR